MMKTLRNGTITADPRCDLIFDKDERSKGFRVRSSVQEDIEIKTILHHCDKVLDQGKEGACVGFGLAHGLISMPYGALGLNAEYAKEHIYWPAQRADQWKGGDYPGAFPKYEGTSVLAGLKVLVKLGWIKEYNAALSLREVLIGLQTRPAVCGVKVFEGMMYPDKHNFIHNTGEEIGGHCLCLLGYNDETKVLTWINSWGLVYGDNGLIYMTLDEFDELRKDGGEVFFFDLKEDW